MTVIVTLKGGPGSGHRDHAGRPGKVGGSQPDDGSGGMSSIDKFKRMRRLYARRIYDETVRENMGYGWSKRMAAMIASGARKKALDAWDSTFHYNPRAKGAEATAFEKAAEALDVYTVTMGIDDPKDVLLSKPVRIIWNVALREHMPVPEYMEGRKLGEVDPIVPKPPAEYMHAVEVAHKDNLESGGNPADEMAKANQHNLEEFIECSNVFIRIDGHNLEKVLSDGRFKSQFEVHHSGGMYNPEYRKRFERDYMGVRDDADPATERPIYGYIHTDAYGRGLFSASTYGDVVVRLKAEVRNRTTFVFEDSFSMDGGHVSYPSPVNAPSWHSLMGGVWPGIDSKSGMPLVSSYVEAQIFGGVRLQDIEWVTLSNRFEHRRLPYKELSNMLRSLGIKVYVSANDYTLPSLYDNEEEDGELWS